MLCHKEIAPHLECGSSKLVKSVRMYSSLFQYFLHLSRVTFGCSRRQSTTGVHLNKDHYILSRCLGSRRGCLTTSSETLQQQQN